MRHWTRLKDWLPAIVWAGVISGLSTDTFSGSHTSILIVPFLHWLLPHANEDTIELLHGFVRKLAHFTEYFILSVFLIRGLRGKNRGWNLRLAIWAVVIAAVYSSFDEFHQLFVPSRHASPWDALLDTTGATAAQILLWLWRWPRPRLTVRGDKENAVSNPD